MRLPDPIANTTTEAYLAYKAGVLAEGDLKPKLYEPYIHLDAWLAYWTGLTTTYPVKNVGKNLFNMGTSLSDWFQTYHDGLDINAYTVYRTTATIEDNKLVVDSYDNTGWTWISRWVSLEKNTVYSISGVNTQAIRVVGFNSKEQSAQGTLIKVKPTAPGGGHVSFNTGNYNYYAVSFYPSEAGSYFENIQIEKGSTATTYEPYSGVPEMLTDEEAYIAYLSGVTDTYPEEFRDPADIRVAAYLRYLISARWGRPEYPVTNEELYLSMQKPPYVPSGDPSSDIVIDGTAKAAFVDIKMYGDTAQQTYDGRNLVGLAGITFPYTLNGVTVTRETDGSFTFNGTLTATTNFDLSPWANQETYNSLLPYVGQTVTLSCETSGSVTDLDFRNYGLKRIGGDTFINSSITTPRTATFTMSNNTTVLGIRLGGGTFTNWNIKIQLELGSTATAYEPYVGGQASPNPDYPQPIRTVTGRQVVNVTGKNRLRQIDGTYSRNGITATVNNGKITLNGTATATAYIPLSTYSDYYSLDLSGVYTLSATSITGVSYTIYQGGASVLYSTSSSQTKTLSGTYENVRFQINVAQGTTLNNVVVEAQLEAGSTATDYEPYSSNDYEINLGKNLFSSRIVRGYYAFANGNYSSYSSSYVTSEDKIPVEAGQTYTISANKGVYDGSDYTGAGVVFFNNGTYVSSILRPANGTFTVPSGANQVIYNFYKGSSDSSITPNDITWVQLELGSTATTYAPYFTPIELCKLGDYQDYIWKDGEDWKVHKATNKITVDGSENWVYPDSGANYTFFQFSRNNFRTKYGNAADFYASITEVGFAKADKFEQIVASSANMRTEQGIGFTTEGNGWFRISVANTIATTIKTFKAWLAENVVTVLYALETQTDTVITNQNLIDQLNALKQGGAEEGTTYIKVSATDPNLPAKLYVEAPKYE